MAIREVLPGHGGGGGRGALIFSSYVGSGPASTVPHKNYLEFRASKKTV